MTRDVLRNADVVVVGVGLAGLCVGLPVVETGLDVPILEASNAVGGGVCTDRVDGLQLDCGFQLPNLAYAEARRVLDRAALDLRPMTAGRRVAMGSRHHQIVDPRRVAGSALRAARIGPGLADPVLRSFFAGVFAEDELATSRHLLDLALRGTVRGTPSVPVTGMSASTEQLAARLPVGCVRRNTQVDRKIVTSAIVGGHMAAAQLPPGLDVPALHALTTWYHLADTSAHLLCGSRSVLVVDGQRRGPVVNTVVLTHTAPSYAARGRVLVSSTALRVRGGEGGAAGEADLRGHLGLLYGVDTRGWKPVAHHRSPRRSRPCRRTRPCDAT